MRSACVALRSFSQHRMQAGAVPMANLICLKISNVLSLGYFHIPGTESCDVGATSNQTLGYHILARIVQVDPFGINCLRCEAAGCLLSCQVVARCQSQRSCLYCLDIRVSVPMKHWRINVIGVYSFLV